MQSAQKLCGGERERERPQIYQAVEAAGAETRGALNDDYESS